MVIESGQPHQISDFKLKFSYWYVSNKLLLRRILVVFLILLNVGLFSYSIYSAVMTLFVYDQDYREAIEAMAVNSIDYQYFHEKNKPQDLEILGVDAVEGNENQYDFVVKISNANEKWVAREAVVQLIGGGEVAAEKTTFIYPGETKYVVFFSQEGVDPGSAQIRIYKVDWRRYSDFAELSRSRLNFEVSDIEFKSARDSGIERTLPVSLLTFKIKNNTAYDYWQIGIYMILMSGQKVGGANYLSLSKFLSGEIRDVEMRWYESLPSIYNIQILPEVDILDQSSYITP